MGIETMPEAGEKEEKSREEVLKEVTGLLAKVGTVLGEAVRNEEDKIMNKLGNLVSDKNSKLELLKETWEGVKKKLAELAGDTKEKSIEEVLEEVTGLLGKAGVVLGEAVRNEEDKIMNKLGNLVSDKNSKLALLKETWEGVKGKLEELSKSKNE
ncbi:MAG: hypothetical protein Q8Q06_02535 [bacterium]|nr:hypothetical protein [bacterium]